MKKLLLLLVTLLLVFSCDVAGQVNDAAEKVEDAVDEANKTSYVDTWAFGEGFEKVTLILTTSTYESSSAMLTTKGTLNNDDENTVTITSTHMMSGGTWFSHATLGSDPITATWDWVLSNDGNTLTLTDPNGVNSQQVFTRQ